MPNTPSNHSGTLALSHNLYLLTADQLSSICCKQSVNGKDINFNFHAISKQFAVTHKHTPNKKI